MRTLGLTDVSDAADPESIASAPSVRAGAAARADPGALPIREECAAGAPADSEATGAAVVAATPEVSPRAAAGETAAAGAGTTPCLGAGSGGPSGTWGSAGIATVVCGIRSGGVAGATITVGVPAGAGVASAGAAEVGGGTTSRPGSSETGST